MPITKSAKKVLRQTERRRVRNLKKKEAYKAAVKQFKKLAAAKQFDEASKILSKVYKTVDKAAKTGVIKPNKASRIKSRTSHLLAVTK